MAKLSPKQKHMKRLTQQIRRMEKRGYIFPDDIREELKSKNARQLAQLKTPWLYKKAEYVEPDTGEIVSAEAGRKQERSRASKKAAQTRNIAKQKSKQVTEPWIDQDAEESQIYLEDVDLHEEYLPDYSDISLANLEDLISTLQQSPKDSTVGVKGRTVLRWGEIKELEQQGKNMLQSLLQAKIKEVGYEAVAKRIADSGNEISDALDTLTNSYSDEMMVGAINTIARIINGAEMSNAELASYSDFQEVNESW